jgi:phasin
MSGSELGLRLRVANSARGAKDGRSAGGSRHHTREAEMANEPWKNFEVPTQMRQLAEQSVEQARKAVDGFMTAAQKAVTTAESQAATAQTSAKDVGTKAMSFAEQNIANSFDFAQKLVRAKDLQEVMALQQEYLQTQMKAMSEQAKDLGSVASKAAMDSAKPKF